MWGGEWRFSHDKIREVLLSELAIAERSALHCQVAEAVETVYPEDNRYFEVLLAHWHQAGYLDKELRYLDLVAERLIHNTLDYPQARSLLERGLEQLPRDDTRRIPLLNWLVVIHNLQHEYNQSKTLAQRSLELAQNSGDQKSIVSSLNRLGDIFLDQGDNVQALSHFEQSLAIARKGEDGQGMASSLNYLGNLAHKQEDFAKALDYYHQSLVIRQGINDQQGVAQSYINLGSLEIGQRHWESARDYLLQSLSLSQAIKNQTKIAASLVNLAAVVGIQGDIGQVGQYSRQSLVISEANGDRRGIMINSDNLAYIAYLQHDYEMAQKYIHQSLAISQAIGDQPQIANSLTNLGFVYLKTQPEAAPDIFHQALALSYANKLVSAMLELLLGFGWLRMQSGDRVGAAELVGLVRQHPAQTDDTRLHLNELMPELEAGLSPDELTAAMERGKTLDLEAAVQDLLAQ